jgi:NitT/TauT family transport system substrate-binding protein
VIKKVLTQPPDRILTGELFPVIKDLDTIQKYMMDEMKIMTSLIDLDKFINTEFAIKAGAK